MDLIQFQFDVANNHHENIKAFIAALAQERGNKNLERLSQEFGFVTGHWESLFEGHRVALGKDLNKLLYGVEKTTHLRQLCERHGLSVFTLKGSDHTCHSLLKAHFHLAATVNTAHLVAWPHILLAAAYGETAFARKLMAYIMTMVQVAEAEQESRTQTGLGLQENIQQQLGQPSEALMWQQATDEFEAKQRWLLAIGYHPSTALLEAGKHTMRVTGMDLAADLNGSPLLQHVPPENQYYLVSSLEKRFELPREGQHGHFLNKLLANYGMQTRLANGEWQPTSKGQAERIHSVPVYKPATIISKQWSGPLLEWHVDFVAKVAEWYHRSHRQEVAHGHSEN